LIPEHFSWYNYFKKNELEFKFINNFTQSFYKTPKENPLFLSIFVNDIIQFNKIYKISELKRIYNSILDSIKFRLKNSSSPLFVFLINKKNQNIFDYLSNKNNEEMVFENLNKKIHELTKKYLNLYYINFNSIIENSQQKIFDNRNWYLANCRLSSDGLDLLASTIFKINSKIYSAAKKVLVLDCDNTLWGGIIGEDGMKNIKLGQDGVGKAFLDFQKVIKKISNDGTLLCISSKNNYEDVINVFENHKQMQIKKKDLLSIKVNWKEKYINLKEISKELNLSLDSMVFWDDNPLERNKIKKFLPEVHVVEPDDQITNWPEQLVNLDMFSKINVTKEDRKKLIQYKIRSKFVNEKKLANDELSYLKSIKLKPKILKLSKDNLSRASQMTQKTNQFNLRTKRYSINDIQKLEKNSNYIIRLVELSDIYGNHGIVGLIILEKIDKNSIFINSFLISCRVFGRYLETWMLYEIKKICEKQKIPKIIGEHLFTQKNLSICKDFFQNHSFKKITKDLKINKTKGIAFEINVKNLANNKIKAYD